MSYKPNFSQHGGLNFTYKSVRDEFNALQNALIHSHHKGDTKDIEEVNKASTIDSRNHVYDDALYAMHMGYGFSSGKDVNGRPLNPHTMYNVTLDEHAKPAIMYKAVAPITDKEINRRFRQTYKALQHYYHQPLHASEIEKIANDYSIDAKRNVEADQDEIHLQADASRHYKGVADDMSDLKNDLAKMRLEYQSWQDMKAYAQEHTSHQIPVSVSRKALLDGSYLKKFKNRILEAKNPNHHKGLTHGTFSVNVNPKDTHSFGNRDMQILFSELNKNVQASSHKSYRRAIESLNHRNSRDVGRYTKVLNAMGMDYGISSTNLSVHDMYDLGTMKPMTNKEIKMRFDETAIAIGNYNNWTRAHSRVRHIPAEANVSKYLDAHPKFADKTALESSNQLTKELKHDLSTAKDDSQRKSEKKALNKVQPSRVYDQRYLHIFGQTVPSQFDIEPMKHSMLESRLAYTKQVPKLVKALKSEDTSKYVAQIRSMTTNKYLDNDAHEISTFDGKTGNINSLKHLTYDTDFQKEIPYSRYQAVQHQHARELNNATKYYTSHPEHAALCAKSHGYLSNQQIDDYLGKAKMLGDMLEQKKVSDKQYQFGSFALKDSMADHLYMDEINEAGDNGLYPDYSDQGSYKASAQMAVGLDGALPNSPVSLNDKPAKIGHDTLDKLNKAYAYQQSMSEAMTQAKQAVSTMSPSQKEAFKQIFSQQNADDVSTQMKQNAQHRQNSLINGEAVDSSKPKQKPQMAQEAKQKSASHESGHKSFSKMTSKDLARWQAQHNKADRSKLNKQKGQSHHHGGPDWA